jgi:hypothetical protein
VVDVLGSAGNPLLWVAVEEGAAAGLAVEDGDVPA